MIEKVELPGLPGKEVRVIGMGESFLPKTGNEVCVVDVGHPGKGLRDFIRESLPSLPSQDDLVCDINFLDAKLVQNEQN